MRCHCKAISLPLSNKTLVVQGTAGHAGCIFNHKFNINGLDCEIAAEIGGNGVVTFKLWHFLNMTEKFKAVLGKLSLGLFSARGCLMAGQ